MLKLVTGPLASPISLAEMKQHLRVDGSDDDAYITALTAAAVRLSEEYCRRAWMPQSWRLSLDEFPTEDGGLILLERSPVTGITGFLYTDVTGVSQALMSGDYQLDSDSEPARVKPPAGKTWPSFSPGVLNAVQITFTAGYADAAAVPEIAKAAIKHTVATWYDNRADVTTGTIATQLPGLGMRILDTADLRLFRY